MSDEEPRRAIGRPRSIDREKIIAAAHRIGLENLTMRAIAEDLGVTTQALYNHIGGRRELLVLLANDHGELFAVDDDLAEAGWRPWITAFATALRDHLRDNPGLIASVVTRGPTTPAAVTFVERTVDKMTEAGFSPEAALRSYRIVLEFVVGWAHHHDTLPPIERPPAAETASPLHDAIVAAWTDDGDQLFAFGLDALLDGLERSCRAERPARTSARTTRNAG